MQFALTSLVVLGSIGCSAKYTQLPPKLDLQPYGRVAIIPFAATRADTSFAALATRRFAEDVLAAQPGVELLELGESDPLVRAFRRTGDASALTQALGKDREVMAVFLGQLTLSEIKPTVRLSASSVRARATVNADLAVRMLATRSGGTVWRSSFTGTSSVGNMSLRQGLPSISVRDPAEAYEEIVRVLVGGVTRDFRPSVVRM
jgi:hypothetical protein